MRNAKAALAATALAALAGCSPDFLPPSYLNGLRVLAVTAAPLEVAPASPVLALTPVVYSAVTSASGLSEAWSFCPASAGSVSGYACAVPECQLGPPAYGCTFEGCALSAAPAAGGSIAVTFGPGCFSPALPSPLQTFFRFCVSETPSGSPCTEPPARNAVLQVPVWPDGFPPGHVVNLPPIIARVDIAGGEVYPTPPGAPPSLPNGGTVPVRVMIDPSSVQTYVDADGVTRVETMTVDYYATAGRFASDLATGVDTTVNLQGTSLSPQDLADGLDVYVVAIDLRGGQAVAGPFHVTVGPPP